MTTDPHAALRDMAFQTVLDGDGECDPALRRAAAKNGDLPADLRALVDKIHNHAYRVTDDEMAQAQAKYGDDAMFEIVVSAALGAAGRRLFAGLKALEDA